MTTCPTQNLEVADGKQAIYFAWPNCSSFHLCIFVQTLSPCMQGCEYSLKMFDPLYLVQTVYKGHCRVPTNLKRNKYIRSWSSVKTKVNVFSR